MKRRKSEKGGVDSAPVPNNFVLKKQTSADSSVVYQSKKENPTKKYKAPSPTNKHQIAPGLVIEGEEIDL